MRLGMGKASASGLGFMRNDQQDPSPLLGDPQNQSVTDSRNQSINQSIIRRGDGDHHSRQRKHVDHQFGQSSADPNSARREQHQSQHSVDSRRK